MKEETTKNARMGTIITELILATVGVTCVICVTKAYRNGYVLGFANGAETSFQATMLWLKEDFPEAYKEVAEWIAANPDKMVSTKTLVADLLSAASKKGM